MIGLGVGVDYALFVLSRFREASRRGLDPRAAAAESLARGVALGGVLGRHGGGGIPGAVPGARARSSTPSPSGGVLVVGAGGRGGRPRCSRVAGLAGPCGRVAVASRGARRAPRTRARRLLVALGGGGDEAAVAGAGVRRRRAGRPDPAGGAAPSVERGPREPAARHGVAARLRRARRALPQGLDGAHRHARRGAPAPLGARARIPAR